MIQPFVPYPICRIFSIDNTFLKLDAIRKKASGAVPFFCRQRDIGLYPWQIIVQKGGFHFKYRILEPECREITWKFFQKSASSCNTDVLVKWQSYCMDDQPADIFNIYAKKLII